MNKQQIINIKGNRPVYYKSISEPDYQVDVPSRKISGYLASWGNIDLDRDILVKGCCSKSLQEHGVGSKSAQKIILLYMHDMDQPMGRFTRLEEDEKGLYYEAECDALERIDEVLYQMSTGTINQHSIGFRYLWDKMEYDDTLDAYVCKEIRLFEGSVVTIGANENTPFTGFKAAELADQQSDLLQEFEYSIKKFDEKTQYKLRQIYAKQIALSETLTDVDQKELLRQQPKAADWLKIANELKHFQL